MARPAAPVTAASRAGRAPSTRRASRRCARRCRRRSRRAGSARSASCCSGSAPRTQGKKNAEFIGVRAGLACQRGDHPGTVSRSAQSTIRKARRSSRTPSAGRRWWRPSVRPGTQTRLNRSMRSMTPPTRRAVVSAVWKVPSSGPIDRAVGAVGRRIQRRRWHWHRRGRGSAVSLSMKAERPLMTVLHEARIGRGHRKVARRISTRRCWRWAGCSTIEQTRRRRRARRRGGRCTRLAQAPGELASMCRSSIVASCVLAVAAPAMRST